MILDGNEFNTDNNQIEADLIIVGAGTVGLFLCHCFGVMSPNLRIVVIESGDEVPVAGSITSTPYSVGKVHLGSKIGRAFGIGGTSTLWGGQLDEFTYEDVEGRNSKWPISYQELKLLYREIYCLLDLNVKSQSSYKTDFGSENENHDEKIERYFSHWLLEPNFSLKYKKLILSKSVRLIKNTTAFDISFEKDTAKHIKCKSSNGKFINFYANDYIFSCGTIEIIRFFLSTQKQGLVPWSNNNNIGSYFQDHLGGEIAKVKVLNINKFRDYFENVFIDGQKLMPKLRLNSKGMKDINSSACGFFIFSSNFSDNINNLKTFIRAIRSNLKFSYDGNIIHDLVSVINLIIPISIRFIKTRRIMAIFDKEVSFHVQAEQIPQRTSKIYISDNERIMTNGLYKITLDWKFSGEEFNSIRKFALYTDNYLQHRKIAQLKINEKLLAKNTEFMDSLFDTYHQSGGMIMSKSSSNGVVDPNCLVWGSKNVWVAGSAIFPNSSHANTTLTSLALSLKLATHLLKSIEQT
jgi:hypothetical protein